MDVMNATGRTFPSGRSALAALVVVLAACGGPRVSPALMGTPAVKAGGATAPAGVATRAPSPAPAPIATPPAGAPRRSESVSAPRSLVAQGPGGDAASPPPAASRIGALAARMAPGTLAELTDTNNIDVFSTEVVTGPVLAYNEGAVWDPLSHRWFALGGSHNASAKLWSYDDVTATWGKADLPVPLWPGPKTTMHGYDHLTIDPAGRMLYARRFGSNVPNMNRYDLGSGAWTALPGLPTADYIQCCGSLTFFPDMVALLYVNDTGLGATRVTVYRLDTGASSWTTLTPTGLADLNIETGANSSIYNPVHDVVLVAGKRAVYRITATGAVTRMTDAPAGIPGIGTQGTVGTVDPVSGEFIFVGANRLLYVYNLQTDSWRSRDVSGWPLFDGDPNGVWGISAAPIDQHGVILFLRTRDTSAAAFLYKHAP